MSKKQIDIYFINPNSEHTGHEFTGDIELIGNPPTLLKIVGTGFGDWYYPINLISEFVVESIKEKSSKGKGADNED